MLVQSGSCTTSDIWDSPKLHEPLLERNFKEFLNTSSSHGKTTVKQNREKSLRRDTVSWRTCALDTISLLICISQRHDPYCSYASINSIGAHPSGQPRGICSRCQFQGFGICNFIAARGLGISVPRGDPQNFVFWHTCFRKMDDMERTRPLSKTGLSVRD